MTGPAGAFAASLKRLRDERGWTQRQLAAATGISRATIIAVEGGHVG